MKTFLKNLFFFHFPPNAWCFLILMFNIYFEVLSLCWLIFCIFVYVPLENITFKWRPHRCLQNWLFCWSYTICKEGRVVFVQFYINSFWCSCSVTFLHDPSMFTDLGKEIHFLKATCVYTQLPDDQQYCLIILIASLNG